VKLTAEQRWILLGRRGGRVWLCRRVRPTTGDRVSVGFDGSAVLDREETHGDVAGFLHTHPDGPATPSDRDVRTMRAWCGAFGKPLLCLIVGPNGVGGYRFEDTESTGRPLAAVELFPRGVVVGVEADG
jgi:proteasome lid subunit RPN8/RPN11